MEDKDILNLECIEDLPDNLKKQLRLNRQREVSSNLLSLFDIKNPLSYDEMIVGLYRKYNLLRSRSWLTATLYNLKKYGLVKKIEGEKSMYERINK